MRITIRFVLATLLAGAWLAGCGEDRIERGLAPPDEEAVPIDPEELEMSEEERRKQRLREEQESPAEFDETLEEEAER